ncbi:MAG: glycosyltransferase [Desulfovibrio sp.]|nr:glycosyltransferase [Desulfovibrio sp.]
MSKPIRVLFLMEDLCFGGTQRQTVELVLRLDRARFSPVMLVLTGKTDLDAVVRDAGIPVTYLNSSRRVSLFFWVRLASSIRALAPDLIIPCTALPNIWGRIWGKVLSIPVLGTCRGGGGPKRQHERWLWRLTQKIICNSRPLFDDLCALGIPKEHLLCIPNGVDTDFFMPDNCPPSKRSPVLLCVARLAEDKDHLTLFRAFKRILKVKPDVRLRLVGDGPEEGALKAWAKDHLATVGAQMDFIPGTADVRPHYASARAFVLSSVREGLPNVLLEAMSCGLPVCATSVGGIPSIVHEGKTGFLSSSGDDETFASNCLRLLESPDLCDAMGRAGRKLIEEGYSFATMVRAHEDAILKLYGGRHA